MRINLKMTLAATAVSILAACGGGGGSSTTPNAVIEGVWSGTSSLGHTLNALSLENGSTYVIFGTITGNVFGVMGFDQGTITASGNAISGSLREYLPNGTMVSGSISGTVVPGTSITGTTVYGATTTSVNFAPISASLYSYSATPNLSDVSGSWTGTMLDGTAATVTINNTTGAIAGTNGGCSFTGTTAPRASGKNVFDVTVTFGGAPCVLPGQQATGVAIDYVITGTPLKQLLVAVQDSTKAHGTMFIASR